MKDYPSIPRATGTSFHEFDAHVFDKLDGSGLRFEWSPKAGWYKVGTRTRLLDPADPVFGPALPMFLAQSAEPLAALARRQRWQGLVVFAEWWGAKSFAGVHVPGDAMALTVFDLAPLRKGILPPTEFRKLVEGLVPTPRFLGRTRWTRGYVERVRAGEVEGITFEGVVGKAPGKQGPLMAKAKTQAWLNRVKALYAPDVAERIINS
jgi:hypothetical protein